VVVPPSGLTTCPVLVAMMKGRGSEARKGWAPKRIACGLELTRMYAEGSEARNGLDPKEIALTGIRPRVAYSAFWAEAGAASPIPIADAPMKSVLFMTQGYSQRA